MSDLTESRVKEIAAEAAEVAGTKIELSVIKHIQEFNAKVSSKFETLAASVGQLKGWQTKFDNEPRDFKIQIASMIVSSLSGWKLVCVIAIISATTVALSWRPWES